MKSHLFMAWSLFVYASLFIGTAIADDGVGACVGGTGFEIANIGAGTYVGVNVHSPVPASQDVPGTPVTSPFTLTTGAGNETAVYDNSADFQTNCCNEAGLPADCFAPVG